LFGDYFLVGYIAEGELGLLNHKIRYIWGAKGMAYFFKSKNKAARKWRLRAWIIDPKKTKLTIKTLAKNWKRPRTLSGFKNRSSRFSLESWTGRWKFP
jgi:hypothetical protein